MYEHGNMNIEQQKEAYSGFVKLFTYGTIASLIIAAIVVAVIT